LTAAVVGVQLKTWKPLNDGMRTILGVAIGATITSSFFLSLPSLVPTLIMVPLLTIGIGICGVLYFKKFLNYDFPTAYYASMPGGLQDMILFGEEAGANVRAISLIHATRVLIIVITLPLILTQLWDVNLMEAPGAMAGEVGASQIIILAFCGLLGWQAAKRVGMFGASILGPLILTGIASMLGIVTMRPPAEAIWGAQYFIAMGIGVKYVGITVDEIRRDILAGLGFSLFLFALTALTIEIALIFSHTPVIETILALTPGGQAELVVLALIVGADMTFVVAHHLLRIFFVILGAPVVAMLIPAWIQD
ncbi:MAG: AbrB family transcriptional regulator, partial [Paracoccaceae bacterium]